MAKEMRKTRIGQVVRHNNDTTATVEMVWRQRHRVYKKQVRRVANFYVHDANNDCSVGDTVKIEETRPISKNKHWRLIEVVTRKQIAEIQPNEIN